MFAVSPDGRPARLPPAEGPVDRRDGPVCGLRTLEARLAPVALPGAEVFFLTIRPADDLVADSRFIRLRRIGVSEEGQRSMAERRRTTAGLPGTGRVGEVSWSASGLTILGGKSALAAGLVATPAAGQAAGRVDC
jgi:hypothetical protein